MIWSLIFMWTCSLNEVSQIELAPNVPTRSHSVFIYLPCTLSGAYLLYTSTGLFMTVYFQIFLVWYNTTLIRIPWRLQQCALPCCVHCGHSTMCIFVRHAPWPCNNMSLVVVLGLVSRTLSSRTWQFTQTIKLSHLSYQSENRKSTLAGLILLITCFRYSLC